MDKNATQKVTIDYASRTLLTQGANRQLDFGLFWCDEDIDQDGNLKQPGQVPIERIVAKAVELVRAGKGRNNTGFWLFCQLRDARYYRDETETRVLQDWVRLANEAKPGPDKYTLQEAKATLRSVYQRPARRISRGLQ